MPEPSVSVIIPAHGRADFLERAIRSVLAQTYQDYEVIVVDDGSHPPLLEQLSPEARSAIRYRYKQSGGGASARNVGVTMARAPLVAFLDHDDSFLPEKLSTHVQEMRADDAVLSYCAVRRFRSGIEKDVRPAHGRSGWIFDALVEKSIVRGFSSMVIRRSALTEVGPLDESFRIIDDYDLCFRLAERGTFRFIPHVLVEVELHDENTSSDRLALHLEYARLFARLLTRHGGRRGRALRRKAAYHHRKAGDEWMARGARRRALLEYGRCVATWPLSATGVGRLLLLPLR
jgi:glycosyltransferase involved in cell wall biosynthesis